MVARDRLSYVLGLRLLKPFRHSEYRRLIAALAVSVIGAGMWTVVMPMQVLELKDDDAQGSQRQNHPPATTPHARPQNLTRPTAS